MSIPTALEARRAQLRDREAGFTLIELLVVVIIIGILAAIAIPVYIGVQNNAKNSALQSDLTNAKTAYIAYVSDKGSAPTAIANLTDYGYASSGYTATGAQAPAIKTGNTATTFCIDGKSNAGQPFNITATTSVAAGLCP
jgi:prepilin-type N-terminal cleavage/methylation domain-containing protein